MLHRGWGFLQIRLLLYIRVQISKKIVKSEMISINVLENLKKSPGISTEAST